MNKDGHNCWSEFLYVYYMVYTLYIMELDCMRQTYVFPGTRTLYRDLYQVILFLCPLGHDVFMNQYWCVTRFEKLGLLWWLSVDDDYFDSETMLLLLLLLLLFLSISDLLERLVMYHGFVEWWDWLCYTSAHCMEL